MRATTDYQMHHFIEPRASEHIRSVIAERSQAVWEAVSHAGTGGPLNCLGVCIRWSQEFERAGIVCEFHGRSSDITIGLEGGGYREDGGIVDHHFLVVGPERALFDPTAGQFGDPNLVRLDDYFVLDTQGRREVAFVEWREFPEVVERFCGTRQSSS